MNEQIKQAKIQAFGQRLMDVKAEADLLKFSERKSYIVHF